jgi:sortase A
VTEAARSALRLGERSLLAAAVLCLGAFAYAHAQARWFAFREGSRLAALFEAAPERATSHAAPRTRGQALRGRAWGRIEFPRQGVDALVAEGVDDATLAVAVGHVPGTAFPGERGNLALAGHRDSFFRVLEDVRRNDVVRVATPDGVFRYRIEELSVVDPDDRQPLAATGSPVLTLVTCYPFGYVGRAPLRYVVRARLLPDAADAPSRDLRAEASGLQGERREVHVPVEEVLVLDSPQEVDAEVRERRRGDAAPSRAEDALEGRLPVPAPGGQEADDDRDAHERREEKCREPGPDDRAGPGVAVDLGQDVPEGGADRDEQDARPECAAPAAQADPAGMVVDSDT